MSNSIHVDYRFLAAKYAEKGSFLVYLRSLRTLRWDMRITNTSGDRDAKVPTRRSLSPAVQPMCRVQRLAKAGEGRFIDRSYAVEVPGTLSCLGQGSKRYSELTGKAI
jgi:hypothetical protein